MRPVLTRRIAIAALVVSAAVVMIAAAGGRAPQTTPGTGFPGGIQTGIKPVLDGHLSDADGLIRVRDGLTENAVIEVITILLENDDCRRGRPGLRPCLRADQAHVDFTISALLDFRVGIPLDGERTKRFRHHGPDPVTRQVRLGIPPLAPGRHCLMIAVAEDASAVVANQSPDHTTVLALPVSVGGGSDNYCDDVELVDDQVARPKRHVAGNRCAFPVLGPDADGLTLKRQLDSGEKVYAAIPLCGERTTAVFMHNEVLVADGPFALSSPASGRAERRIRIRELGVLPTGSWRLALFADYPTDGRAASAVSMPVLAP